jgi:DNA-binding NarL/FixJ family response regulator
MKTLSILIADDHPVVRRGLRALLETESGWKVVAEAANGREAVAKAAQLHPDLVLMDLSMPKLNGLDACCLIAQSSPQTRVLIITMHRAPELVAQMLKAGARGYVLKSDPERDLIAAVEALAHNRTFFTAVASDVFLDRLRGDNRFELDSPLSLREREITQLVAEGKSNKEVATILGISARTAENHRARVMDKLGFHSLADLVRYAIRNKMVEA